MAAGSRTLEAKAPAPPSGVPFQTSVRNGDGWEEGKEEGNGTGDHPCTAGAGDIAKDQQYQVRERCGR